MEQMFRVPADYDLLLWRRRSRAGESLEFQNLLYRIQNRVRNKPGAARAIAFPPDWRYDFHNSKHFMIRSADMDRNTHREPLPPVDENLVDAIISLYELAYRYYFRVSVSGLEHLPKKGPALLVGNHSGAINSPDMLMLFVAWYRHQGLERPLRALAHDAFFSMPGVGGLLRRFGAVPASPEAAAHVFAEDGFLLVYPGGDADAFKSFASRNRIQFFGRRGFIRLAMRHGVPIIPVCARGGHETLVVLSSGRRLSSALGLDKLLRVSNMPVSFSIPWGITPGPFLPYIPFPVHIRLKFGAPIPFADMGPESADDPAVVDHCCEVVRETMQGMLNSMSGRKKS